jgi:hypothetical protein
MKNTATNAKSDPGGNTSFPTFTWLGRMIFSKHNLRQLLFLLAAMITLVTLAYAVENWRGHRAWTAYKRQLETKGERLNLDSYIPPPVPEDQNFASTPLLKPLFEYTYRSGVFLNFRDTNAQLHAQTVFWRHKDPASEQSSWRARKTTDLVEWEANFRHEAADPNHVSEQTRRGLVPIVIPSQTVLPGAVILAALKPVAPRLEELSAASLRRSSRFDVHYAESYNALLPHLAILKGAGRVFALRASAHLALENSKAAAEDTKASLRMASALDTEAFFISLLVRLAILDRGLQPLWEGLATRRWSEDQLREFQSLLEPMDLLAGLARAFRAERAFSLDFVDLIKRSPVLGRTETPIDGDEMIRLLRLAPRGWLDQNKLAISRAYEDLALPLVDPIGHRVRPELVQESAQRFSNQRTDRSPYSMVLHLVFPEFTRSVMRCASVQTALDLALTACALERFRRSNGRFPAALSELVPSFIAKVPTDIITGDSLHYVRSAPDSFLLYSVGWDGRDDAGVPAPLTKGSDWELRANKSLPIEPQTGDWVWSYPTNLSR